MSLLSILGPAVKAVGGILGLGDKAKEIADAISGAPPEVRAQLEQAAMEHEVKMKTLSNEELKTHISESMAMIQSTDKWTSRARPTGLYLAYLFTGYIIIAKTTFAPTLDVAGALMMITPFWGAGVHYQHLRSKEKMNGHNGD